MENLVGVLVSEKTHSMVVTCFLAGGVISETPPVVIGEVSTSPNNVLDYLPHDHRFLRHGCSICEPVPTLFTMSSHFRIRILPPDTASGPQLPLLKGLYLRVRSRLRYPKPRRLGQWICNKEELMFGSQRRARSAESAPEDMVGHAA